MAHFELNAHTANKKAPRTCFWCVSLSQMSLPTKPLCNSPRSPRDPSTGSVILWCATAKGVWGLFLHHWPLSSSSFTLVGSLCYLKRHCTPDWWAILPGQTGAWWQITLSRISHKTIQPTEMIDVKSNSKYLKLNSHWQILCSVTGTQLLGSDKGVQ